MFKSGYKAVASAMEISTPIVDRSVDEPSDKMLRRKKKRLRKSAESYYVDELQHYIKELKLAKKKSDQGNKMKNIVSRSYIKFSEDGLKNVLDEAQEFAMNNPKSVGKVAGLIKTARKLLGRMQKLRKSFDAFKEKKIMMRHMMLYLKRYIQHMEEAVKGGHNELDKDFVMERFRKINEFLSTIDNIYRSPSEEVGASKEYHEMMLLHRKAKALFRRYSKYIMKMKGMQKLRKSKVDPKQLKMGIKIEYEHTSDKKVAEKIALDHLAEIPNYYTLLTEMESKAKKSKKIKKYALEDSPQTVKVKRAMQAAIIKMNGLSRAILTVLLSSQKPTRATINKFATQMSFAHSLLKKYKKLKGTDEYNILSHKLDTADIVYSRLIKRLGGPDEIQGVQKVFGSAALRAGMAVGRRAIKPLANIARRTSAKAGIKAGKKGLRTGLKAIDRAGRKATVVGRKLARKHVPKKARGAAKFVAPLAGEMAVANRINAVRRRASSAAGFDKAMSDIDGIKKMIVDETKRKKRRKRRSQTPYVHAWRFPGVG